MPTKLPEDLYVAIPMNTQFGSAKMGADEFITCPTREAEEQVIRNAMRCLHISYLEVTRERLGSEARIECCVEEACRTHAAICHTFHPRASANAVVTITVAGSQANHNMACVMRTKGSLSRPGSGAVAAVSCSRHDESKPVGQECPQKDL